jgi:hypothetical protein
MQNSCDILSFIDLYFIYQHIYLYIKCVFNAWYLCVKCMNLWMNEFDMISIVNSSHAKVLMLWCVRWWMRPNNIWFISPPLYVTSNCWNCQTIFIWLFFLDFLLIKMFCYCISFLDIWFIFNSWFMNNFIFFVL